MVDKIQKFFVVGFDVIIGLINWQLTPRKTSGNLMETEMKTLILRTFGVVFCLILKYNRKVFFSVCHI